MLSDGFHDIPAGKLAMVVTYLEMTKPAPLKDVPLPMGVTFREVSPDVDWFRDIFDRVGREWLWFGRRKVDDATLRAVLEDPNILTFTMAKDGQDEALLELDFRQPGECELSYFGLTSKLIGTGAGRALMDRAIAQAWARDITRFHVHTCSIDSQQALSFYLRSGFKPYRLQVEVDDDPRLTGLIPDTAAPHVPIIT